MTDISTLIQNSTSNLWLFIPSAVLLGALHGLEPGHSKTMMAAFIIAIRGTILQAVLLGLSATVSHTAVVWIIALGGMYFGQNWNAVTSEPYLQLVSAILIICVALWMIRQTSRIATLGHQDHNHDHDPEEDKTIDTGHGKVRLVIDEEGTSPRFRLYQERESGHIWIANQISVETERNDGSKQQFTFLPRDNYVESAQSIEEPHEFIARLKLGHELHHDIFDVEFVEHDHHHTVKDYDGLDVSAPGYQDPHELAHANDIRRRFSNRDVTTPQIILFGLTGGLIPCPASITVLLLCLQLKKFALGATLVLSFSLGLAITMVSTGVLAALSMKKLSKGWSGFGNFAYKAPYFSSALILIVGIYLGCQALKTMMLT